jgi:hypothetical protein
MCHSTVPPACRTAVTASEYRPRPLPSTARAHPALVMAGLALNPQPTVHTFTELTGRPGTTFARWAAAGADAFR